MKIIKKKKKEVKCRGFFTFYLRDQADVDVAEVLPLHLELKLSEGLDEGHALDVPHCPPQLLTQNISFIN